jgi:hypothetical protein
LVDLILALKKRFAGEKLAKYAAHTPHVDSSAVHLCAKEQLWSAVPESDDKLCELGWRVADIARHAEISDLELATVVEKEIRSLEIPMEDPVVVQVSDT